MVLGVLPTVGPTSSSVRLHIYDWNIVNCDVKQPIQLNSITQRSNKKYQIGYFQYKGRKVIDLGVIWKGFISGVCMPNMKCMSLTVQKLWPHGIVNDISFSQPVPIKTVICHDNTQITRHDIEFQKSTATPYFNQDS